MIRRILVPAFYAFIAFCVISYFSVMFSLFQSVAEPTRKPVTNLGFPFKYYYQFWLRGSDSPNCGWIVKNFIYDVLITWALVFIIYIVITGIGKSSSAKSHS